MSETRVARRYAEALFLTAEKQDIVSRIEEDLDAIVSLLDNNPEFKHIFLSRSLNHKRKAELADTLFKDRAHPLTLAAIQLILSKKRESELKAIRNEFQVLRRAKSNIVQIRVSSPYALDQAQQNSVVKMMEQKLSRFIEAEFFVDSKLVGGIQVHYEDYLLDGSVTGSFRRLREKLRYDLLKQV